MCAIGHGVDHLCRDVALWTWLSEANTPHPDWYTSVLWKQLVGRSVLNTSAMGDALVLATIDTHFWCGNSGSDVVLAWTNPGVDTVEIGVPSQLDTAACTYVVLVWVPGVLLLMRYVCHYGHLRAAGNMC